MSNQNLDGNPKNKDRMGVFVCDCGDNISSILDVESLTETAKVLPNVVCAEHASYWCSTDGRERILDMIRSEELQKVVVAGCSRRTHNRLFQKTIGQANLNAEMLGIVNIREGCAYPHQAEPDMATARAKDQIEMESAYMSALNISTSIEVAITQKSLVIGGGMAGMTAALELADNGVPVMLVEHTESLASMTITDTPEQVKDVVIAVQNHPDITVHVNSYVSEVGGTSGNHQVTISHLTKQALSLHDTFGVIIVATGMPDEETARLAKLLRLKQDTKGHFAEMRIRLRPERYMERGIYVCGSVHQPCTIKQAQFQAYSAASRALKHLRKKSVMVGGARAVVDPMKCNGCSDCFEVCPFDAVTMIERPAQFSKDSVHIEIQTPDAKKQSLSVIDPILCTGCGNCVSVCPVGAATMRGWSDEQLEDQMHIALRDTSDNKDSLRILIFACEWSGYAAMELAGRQKLSYPSNVRAIRLDCTGRLQPGLILKAFEMGADGVMILGCMPKLCHYERGNEQAAAIYNQVESLVGLLGISPVRLKLAWTPPDDAPAWVELVTKFVEGVAEITGVAK